MRLDASAIPTCPDPLQSRALCTRCRASGRRRARGRGRSSRCRPMRWSATTLDGWYPFLQAHLTAWSNETRVSLFDALILVVSSVVADRVGAVDGGGVAFAIDPAGGSRASVTTVVAASLFYLWFLAAWGLNYARVPLEAFDRTTSRRSVTDAALRALANRATDAVNATYAADTPQGFLRKATFQPTLVTAFHDVERQLGRPRADHAEPSQTHAARAVLPRRRVSTACTRRSCSRRLLNPDLDAAGAARRARARVGASGRLRPRRRCELRRPAGRARRRSRIAVQRLAGTLRRCREPVAARRAARGSWRGWSAGRQPIAGPSPRACNR